MLRRRSSALVADSVPPQVWSTAVLRADHVRRVAVTPAWKDVYGLLLSSALIIYICIYNNILACQ